MTVSKVEVDVLVVGAGFGGIYSVWKCRNLGLRTHLFEGGSSLGGVWYHNSYPGARVDSEYPFYQLSIPEVYKTWNFSERFPSAIELRQYFSHVDSVLGITKHTTFNAEVVSARFDETEKRWDVRTKNGHTARCRYLLLCTGSTYRRFLPEFPNMSDYEGHLHHTSKWPENGLDVKGKKVTVVGAGATAVQVVQEFAKQAAELNVLIRTPNFAFPLQQRKLSVIEQEHLKGFYQGILRDNARNSSGGFRYNRPDEPAYSSVTPEKREALYEELYNRGGFNLLGGVWPDLAIDINANRALYEFWARKTRARISNPAKRDILVPLEPRYAIMTKRTSLEQDYYECLDQDNVRVIDLNVSPIERFTENGIQLGGAHPEELESSAVVMATGYDNYTGSFITMGLTDTNGTDIKDRWKDGVQTYLGLMCAGYPNMWMVYGPHGPTALGNGPTIVELQIDIITDYIVKMREEGIVRLEPTPAAAQEWTSEIHAVSKTTLFEQADSWYMGANIPGKKREMLNYLLGLPAYEASCREALATWKGFNLTKEAEPTSAK